MNDAKNTKSAKTSNTKNAKTSNTKSAQSKSTAGQTGKASKCVKSGAKNDGAKATTKSTKSQKA